MHKTLHTHHPGKFILLQYFTRAFSWLRAPTFIFKTLLRHYAKQTSQ